MSEILHLKWSNEASSAIEDIEILAFPAETDAWKRDQLHRKITSQALVCKYCGGLIAVAFGITNIIFNRIFYIFISFKPYQKKRRKSKFEWTQLKQLLFTCLFVRSFMDHHSTFLYA